MNKQFIVFGYISRIVKLLLYMIILSYSAFSCAKNSPVTCQQIEDVMCNGTRYMQLVFADSKGNYTTGYLESYDNSSQGCLFSVFNAVPIKNPTRAHLQELSLYHEKSVASMKQLTLQRSSVTQRQQVDQLYILGMITADQAIFYYQQIDHSQLIGQAQKKAKSIRAQYKKVAQPKVIKKQGVVKKPAENKAENKKDTAVQKFKINSQTTDFLQAQGIDTAQFESIEGLPIQHQLTAELVDILNFIADYAQHHQREIYQTHLTKHCAHVASLSQQSNIQGALQQAIDGTNCCHGIEHYLKGMISGAGQAYQEFQKALDYFDCVVDRYEHEITQIVHHAAQGGLIAHGLETIVTASMIAAPTATLAVTGIMIGATAYVMGPLCLQAMIDTLSFGGSCIMGNWDKIRGDLDSFGKFISKPETIACMAELAGGAAVPTPNLNYVVEQVLSLRPVIRSVQNVSGEMVQSLYLMTKNQLQKVYTQGVELLQRPEFANFNMFYKKICGFNFFDILPKGHPILAGMEAGLFSSSEQAVLTQLFTHSESSGVGNVVKSAAEQIESQVVQVIEKGAKSLIAKQACSIIQLQEVLEQEIIQALKQPIISTDLTAKITDLKAIEFANLAPKIRQLQDLAKYTDNFKNLDNLIAEDIYYLNRIYELQSYRAQIKNFLDTHKPYFIYENEKYFIEDIASYHIHAGDYYRKNPPRGGHSNFNGSKLNHFKPTVNKHSPLGAKDVIFYNSRNINLIKPSSLYPEAWSEFVCDLKAIEVMMDDSTKIIQETVGVLTFFGKTLEGLEIIVHYDIANKRIKSHYPDLESFQ